MRSTSHLKLPAYQWNAPLLHRTHARSNSRNHQPKPLLVMKFVVTVFFALLVLAIILQLQILSRLDKITRAPRPVAQLQTLPYHLPYLGPSAAEIAAEIRKQTERATRLAGPATFQVQARGGGQVLLSTNGIRYANLNGGPSELIRGPQLRDIQLRVVRSGGLASDLTLISPAGVTGHLEKIKTHVEDEDWFEILFKPDGGHFMPKTWEFHLTFNDAAKKAQKRAFTISYLSEKAAPRSAFSSLVEVSEVAAATP